MDKLIAQNLFKNPFLSQFILTTSLLPFKDHEILKLDSDLSKYEQLFLNPDIENNLISKNELLASFAISKAENSLLTLKEAEDVYKFILQNKDYVFISNKIKAKQKLTRKDYEKLEFFNIAKTFRKYNENPVHIKDIDISYIRDLHVQLTQGLDIFKDYLPDIDIYKSGIFRDSNNIRVGTYIPSDYHEINNAIEELLLFVKHNQTITAVGIFHTALYALHPFNNGNKRVSRMLEHIFLRSLGVNSKNLYSTSYYYHKEKQRYYKYLLYSLERKNLNHFVSFFEEALTLSIISVIKTSIETKRIEFLKNKDIDDQTRIILRPLIKRKELQFKNLFNAVKGKMARQTFVNYLQSATEKRIIIKRESGRNTHYMINSNIHEEEVFRTSFNFINTRLSFIPDDIKLT
ncbi:MAG: Fic family protein [Patescibacteria group bacterium]